MEDVATIEKQAMIIAAGGRPRDFRTSDFFFRDFFIYSDFHFIEYTLATKMLGFKTIFLWLATK